MNEEDLPELHMSQITRACPMCGERVKLTAKICPHCHRWQNKFQFTVGHPLIWMATFLVIFVALWFGTMQHFSALLLNRGENFGEFTSQIKILSSEMTFINEGKDTKLILLGKVRNVSSVGWREILFQIDFMDKNGKLIDTYQFRDPNLTLYSKGDASFKIPYVISLPQDQYDKHKITVKDAKETSAAL